MVPRTRPRLWQLSYSFRSRYREYLGRIQCYFIYTAPGLCRLILAANLLFRWCRRLNDDCTDCWANHKLNERKDGLEDWNMDLWRLRRKQWGDGGMQQRGMGGTCTYRRANAKSNCLDRSWYFLGFWIWGVNQPLGGLPFFFSFPPFLSLYRYSMSIRLVESLLQARLHLVYATGARTLWCQVGILFSKQYTAVIYHCTLRM